LQNQSDKQQVSCDIPVKKMGIVVLKYHMKNVTISIVRTRSVFCATKIDFEFSFLMNVMNAKWS